MKSLTHMHINNDIINLNMSYAYSEKNELEENKMFDLEKLLFWYLH